MANEWFDSEQQWIDNPEYEWVFDAGGEEVVAELHHIWTDEDYVYAATTSGLFIIDGNSEEQIAYIIPPAGSTDYTTVFSDGVYVYIGSSVAGVKRLERNVIDNGGNLYTSLSDYVNTPDITSNKIKYIHGNDNNLILCTEEGVDIIFKSSIYVTNTTVSGARKCFALNNSYYYTVSGTNNWTLNRVDGIPSNNFVPDQTYTTGGIGFLANATRIKDFYVTENTSTEGNYNTIFAALDTSVSVYDEGSGKYIEFTTVS